MYPASRNPWTNASVFSPRRAWRKPILGILPDGCCPRAARGHDTAAPPTSVMNSRRLMLDMGTSSPVGRRLRHRGQPEGDGIRFTAPSTCRRTDGKSLGQT